MDGRVSVKLPHQHDVGIRHPRHRLLEGQRLPLGRIEPCVIEGLGWGVLRRGGAGGQQQGQGEQGESSDHGYSLKKQGMGKGCTMGWRHGERKSGASVRGNDDKVK